MRQQAPPPVISTDQSIEFVAFTDPAVNLEAMTAETIDQYLRSFDRSLLRFRDGKPKFLTWKIRPLASAEHHYAKLRSGIFSGGVQEPGMGFIYSLELFRLGCIGVEGLPEGFPLPSWLAAGSFTMLDNDWIMAHVPSETIIEIGTVVRRLTEADDDTSSSCLWPSGPASSKSVASPANPAGTDSRSDSDASQGAEPKSK